MGLFVNEDKEFSIFNKRLIDSLCREKFNRKINPCNNTPASIANSNRFYFEQGDKKIFVCYPILLFEKVMQLLLFISYTTDENGKDRNANDLLRLAFNDSSFRSIIKDYSWSSNFEMFMSQLIEESFFYFDDLSNQYYFNLFRKIESGEFTGGYLHALSKHYKDISKFHPFSKEKKDFKYSSLLSDIVLCCINGEIVEKRKANIEFDFHLTKRMDFKTHSITAVLYWDNLKELYLLTTFYSK